ncbi:MAG: inner-rane translocator [Solirubrobacterales bacterium]|jgi:ribose transport system permease protein|nr:inner-rane translocator [Solirubrobacterales bacterium]
MSVASALAIGRARGGQRLSVVRDYGIVMSFVALFVTLTATSDVFLTQRNLLNVLDQSAAVGLMACGGTLVIIAGGFDLSVGAIFAITGVIAASMAKYVDPGFALVLGMLAGLVLGAVNGLLVTVGRVNPFMATLASSIIIRGIALVITGGFLVSVTNRSFSTLGRGVAVLDVKWSIVIWLVFALACGFLLARTTFGRHVYAAGGNADAARLSGISVGVIRTITYAVSGMSAGLAGVIVTSRVSSSQADAGTGIELSVIAAIVIGGTSIMGGEGAIWRSVLGVLLLALIGNGFNLLGVNPIYQQILQGAIILMAVAVDAWARRTRA